VTTGPVVWAHVFVGNAGPGAGFMHPLTGADHLLAMFSVGVLSSRIGGRAIWTVPTSFVVAMLVGGVLGMTGIELPAAELGVAVSVLLLGALLVVGERTPTRLTLAAAAVFGLFHGFAHGREMPLVTSPALYAIGFLASTAGLHVLGALSGALILCYPGGARQLRRAGAFIGVAGMYFAAHALAVVTTLPSLAR
jgi:urease accessory protein